MTQRLSGTGGRELRRHVRQATAQTARIRLADGLAIPCEIRDYCPTGMYVSFSEKNAPDAVLPGLGGAAVEVEFSAGNSGRFRFDGRVAHVSPAGAGIYAPALPEGALAALRAAAEGVCRPADAGAGPDLTPQQAEALRQACSSRFHRFLDAVMEAFFQQAVERLAEAGQEETVFLERSRYEYGARELAQHRIRIRDDFFGAMRGHLQQDGAAGNGSAGEPASRSTLTLVDEAEFEDWLNLSAVIRKIEEEIAPQLDAFEQRYSRLVGAPVDRKSNPFGPEVIARTFQGAVQVLDFSNRMRTVLYKEFGQAISAHAPALYQQLNQTLAALQPAAPPPPAREKAAPPAAAAAEPGADDQPRPELAEIADILNALSRQDQGGTAQRAESADYSLDRILAALNQSPRHAASGEGMAMRSGRKAGAFPGPGSAASGVLRLVNTLQHAARRMEGGDARSLQPADSERGGAPLPEASLPELLAVLDKLPLSGRTAAGMPSLPDRIDAHIASAGGAAGPLAAGHRQILDHASVLFARVQEDFVPSSDMESLLKRLERPLLKLALQDSNFPDLPDHPARQVLDLVEQFAVAADDQGKFFDARLQRFLDLLVDRVCSRTGAEPDIFERVRDSLEKVLLPILQIRRARVARLQEACEGRERIRSARARVNAALEQRLAGREVPAMLLRLLDAGWRQHLVLLEMRQGTQGEAWDAGLAVLDTLLAWLGPDADPHRTGDAAGTVLNEVARTLETVNVDARLVAVFVDELDQALRAQPASAAMVHVPAGRLAAAKGEEDGAPAHRRLAERLRMGDWWTFGTEGSRVPMQLIWVSQPAFGCAFANRSATAKTDLTLAELSRQMRNGLASPGRDLGLPLIERSEHALFDETYQRLVHQALHDPVTGLLNRKGFIQRLEQMAMPDQEGRAHIVCIVEFDQFRVIYNTCGVEAAEALARSLAGEVRALVGPDAVAAAFRDDTLALLLPNCSRSTGCSVVDTLLAKLKDYPFRHAQHSYSIGFNAGLTEYAPARLGAAEAIRHADSACVAAKAQGRNRMQAYEQASRELQSQESLMDWAGRIDSFLKGDGMHLRCQQVRPIAAGSALLPYYEILLGIEGGHGAEIQPVHFIPTVERLQRAHEIDLWVMRKVFEWIAANPASFASWGGFAINLSATSLSSPEVMRYLQKALPDCGFPTDKITFEITETAAIEGYGAAQDFIREIRRHGCKFSLDDFGSGFTSYAHLKNLRADTLKIDGSFVRDMLTNPGDFAMVKSMNDIGHSLGLRTVAEYVESPLILEALREIGVDYAQGYAVHKPCRLDELVLAQTA